LDLLRIKILGPFFRRQLMTGLICLSEFAGGDVGGKLMVKLWGISFNYLGTNQNGLALLQGLDPLVFLSAYKSVNYHQPFSCPLS